MAGTCECGNEPSGSIKYGVFLDKLRIYINICCVVDVINCYNVATQRHGYY